MFYGTHSITLGFSCQNDSTKSIRLGNFYYYLHEITKKTCPLTCPQTDPDPGRTFTTPGGIPALLVSSANLSAVSGLTWAGLITTVLPAARQAAIWKAKMAFSPAV